MAVFGIDEAPESGPKTIRGEDTTKLPRDY